MVDIMLEGLQSTKLNKGRKIIKTDLPVASD